MNTKINKIFYAVLVSCGLATSLTSCSDNFLEVIKPDGEPLEEYYTTEETLNEALTSAYAPLHWPDWDNKAYNDLTIDAEIMGDDYIGTVCSTSRLTATIRWPLYGATSIVVSSVATMLLSMLDGKERQAVNSVSLWRCKPVCFACTIIIYYGITMAMYPSIWKICLCLTRLHK